MVSEPKFPLIPRLTFFSTFTQGVLQDAHEAPVTLTRAPKCNPVGFLKQKQRCEVFCCLSIKCIVFHLEIKI